MKIILCLLVLLCFVGVGSADPVLHFSDITSGPKNGNTDGVGAGAIVTVWGNNLGATQGSSEMYFNDSTGSIYEAAHIYYWENADPAVGDSGPSDLYTYHKMQEIAFSINSSVADGVGVMYVDVDGCESNTLNFTIRSGSIYFSKTSGSNSNVGNWSNPWGQISETAYGATGASSKLSNGSILYACDGITEDDTYIDGDRVVGIRIYQQNANKSHPMALIAYPGATVIAQGQTYGILNHGANNWTYSKLIAKAGNISRVRGVGIDTMRDGRIIANEVTNYPGQCVTGSQGAISGNALYSDKISNLKALGNYLHDWGCNNTSKFEHTFYITNRGGVMLPAYELGWNHLANCHARGGLHVYDEGISIRCGDFSGTLKIHDNAVINQRGNGIGIGTGPNANIPCFTMDIEVYNNLIINGGQGPVPPDGGSISTAAFLLNGDMNYANVSVFNNVFHGYGDTSVVVGDRVCGSGICVYDDFNGSIDFKNNIIVDTNNISFALNQGSSDMNESLNNTWYNGGDGSPTDIPSWDTTWSNRTSDPLFTNVSSGEYTLQLTSPCIDYGTNTASSVVEMDMFGTSRPQNIVFDIGIFEYTTSFIADHGSSYFNLLIPVKNIINSSEYVIWNRTVSGSDEECTFNLEVTT